MSNETTLYDSSCDWTSSFSQCRPFLVLSTVELKMDPNETTPIRQEDPNDKTVQSCWE